MAQIRSKWVHRKWPKASQNGRRLNDRSKIAKNHQEGLISVKATVYLEQNVHFLPHIESVTS